MQLTSDSFTPYGRIPAEFAFGKADGNGGIALSDNRNPQLAWSNPPKGTQCFALICVDPDAPRDANRANTDQPIEVYFERGHFYHWTLANIPEHVREIEAGTHSNQITPRGKTTGPCPAGLQGQNTYTMWFAQDDDMKGIYGGYDGPCPPYNDQRIHGYHFILYALDTELALARDFTGDELEEAMKGHILDRASLVGTYTTNRDLL